MLKDDDLPAAAEKLRGLSGAIVVATPVSQLRKLREALGDARSLGELAMKGQVVLDAGVSRAHLGTESVGGGAQRGDVVVSGPRGSDARKVGAAQVAAAQDDALGDAGGDGVEGH